MNIGKAIRFLRKEKGWTQQQLADFACTSKGNISNLENGHQGYSPSLLDGLSVAFCCPISSIFLLAESFDRLEKNSNKLEEFPIEILFARLPIDIQKKFIALFIEIIKSSADDNL